MPAPPDCPNRPAPDVVRLRFPPAVSAPALRADEFDGWLMGTHVEANVVIAARLHHGIPDGWIGGYELAARQTGRRAVWRPDVDQERVIGRQRLALSQCRRRDEEREPYCDPECLRHAEKVVDDRRVFAEQLLELAAPHARLGQQARLTAEVASAHCVE
jgi:hypothetical protein